MNALKTNKQTILKIFEELNEPLCEKRLTKQLHFQCLLTYYRSLYLCPKHFLESIIR